MLKYTYETIASYCAEARGFLFGTSVSNRLNIGCIPVRKKGKLPPTTVEKQFEYKKNTEKIY